MLTSDIPTTPDNAVGQLSMMPGDLFSVLQDDNDHLRLRSTKKNEKGEHIEGRVPTNVAEANYTITDGFKMAMRETFTILGEDNQNNTFLLQSNTQLDKAGKHIAGSVPKNSCSVRPTCRIMPGPEPVLHSGLKRDWLLAYAPTTMDEQAFQSSVFDHSFRYKLPRRKGAGAGAGATGYAAYKEVLYFDHKVLRDKAVYGRWILLTRGH